MLQVALLGPPRIEYAGRPVHFDTRKAVALLALVSMSEQPLSRDRLAVMLWPDSDDERARGALRRTVSVTAAGVGDALVVSRTTVALDQSKVRVDAVEFRRLLASGDVASLGKAATLYRGDFLTGFAVRDSPDFDDWQNSTADDLRQRLSTALETLVAARVGAGALDEALELARRWVSLDVLHEPAQQADDPGARHDGSAVGRASPVPRVRAGAGRRTRSGAAARDHSALRRRALGSPGRLGRDPHHRRPACCFCVASG